MKRAKPLSKVIPILDRPIIVLRRKIDSLLDTMSVDELRVFAGLGDKYSKARDKYGPLVLATDPRDFDKEADDESEDLLFYLVIARLMKRRAGK